MGRCGFVVDEWVGLGPVDDGVGCGGFFGTGEVNELAIVINRKRFRGVEYRIGSLQKLLTRHFRQQ